jgi:predicted aspartyl protease
VAVSGRVLSSRFPYVPLEIRIGHQDVQVEARLDTGFDGDVALPRGAILSADPPDAYLPCALADGTEVLAPAYDGAVQIGRMPPIPALVIMLGGEPLVGRGISDHFTIILDHGQHLIVEP